ncbi:MAG TPA: hypothetical protein HPP66_07035 [Planctomycetes bacterium]|nr:hypothetical protein [Planctomycetota bacterium]
MVTRNYLSLLLASVLSVSSMAAQDEGKLKEKFFDDCLLHEVEGRIWLLKPMVYLGMWGVLATPPFCLSEDLAARFAPLVSKVTGGDEWPPRRFYSSEKVLREQRGHLILLSMKAEMRAVYDKQPEEVDRTRRPVWPEYYEIVKARMVTAEFVSADWIDGWRKVDEALKEIVTESQTAPSKEKRKRLYAAVEKGRRALNTMSQAKASDDFRALVGKIESDARLVGAFRSGVAEQWQGWLERFAKRLRIRLRGPLPAKPKRWTVLEMLAESKSLAAFRAAVEKMPPENLAWVYKTDIGRKMRAWKNGRLTDEEFEKVRAEVKEMLPELRTWEERLNKEPDVSERETIEELGLVVRPASAKLLEKKLIVSGIEVEKVSAVHEDIGLRAGDIIIDYDRVYSLVMGWHSFSQRTRRLANRMKRGYKPQIIRGNQFIDLAAEDKE